MLSVTVNPCDKAPPFMLNAHERHINDEIKKKWDLGASLSMAGDIKLARGLHPRHAPRPAAL